MARATKIADDGRQRRRHDGLVERRKQHDEQQRGEQQANRRMAGGLRVRLIFRLPVLPRTGVRLSVQHALGLCDSGLLHGGVLKLINAEINICDIRSRVKHESNEKDFVGGQEDEQWEGGRE